MEKVLKGIKIFIVILLVILLSIIAFFGVFKKEKGIWNNVIPDYKYGMDIEGMRELRYALDDSEEDKYVYVDENGEVKGEVWKDGSATTEEAEKTSDDGQASDTEENTDNSEQTEQTEEVPYSKETRKIKVNSDEKLTKENFEKSKKVIQERFKKQGIDEANLRIDDVTGKLEIETKNDNDNVELIENLVEHTGNFKIIDYQNGLVLMDNSDIKEASAIYSNRSGYSTYLQITFNKAGAEKLKEISTKYVEQKSEETTDNSEDSTSTSTDKKYVSIVLDDETLMTTYFGEEMTNGILQINVGENRKDTEYDKFVEDYESAKQKANIINSGILPVTYSLQTDNFVKSDINLDNVKIALVVVVAIISVIFIIKYKLKGIFGAILGIGYIAVFTLAGRYTNVLLTVNSIIAFFAVVIANYVFMNMYLSLMKEMDSNKAYIESMKKFYLSIIPVIVVIIVFTLNNYIVINSIGMMVFWGIFINAIYNFLFTKTFFAK